MIHWKQCPWCATWFPTKYGQRKYCSDSCRSRMWGRYQCLMNQKEIHYVSINGEMYERKNSNEAYEFI